VKLSPASKEPFPWEKEVEKHELEGRLLSQYGEERAGNFLPSPQDGEDESDL